MESSGWYNDVDTEYSTGHHQLQDSRKAVFDEDCEDDDYFNDLRRSCISNVSVLYRTASACSDLLGRIARTWNGSFLYERFFFGWSGFPDNDDQKEETAYVTRTIDAADRPDYYLDRMAGIR